MNELKEAIIAIFAKIVAYALMGAIILASLGALFWSARFFIKQFFGIIL
jgi:hypothetical protein